MPKRMGRSKSRYSGQKRGLFDNFFYRTHRKPFLGRLGALIINKQGFFFILAACQKFAKAFYCARRKINRPGSVAFANNNNLHIFYFGRNFYLIAVKAGKFGYPQSGGKKRF